MAERPEWVRVGLFGAVALVFVLVGIGFVDLSEWFVGMGTPLATALAIVFAIVGIAWWGFCCWLSWQVLFGSWRVRGEAAKKDKPS